MFADFDMDDAGSVFLRRISFDGYGCCGGDFKKMNPADSRVLVEAVDRGAVENPKVETILLEYFSQNSGVIWSDALASNELL